MPVNNGHAGKVYTHHQLDSYMDMSSIGQGVTASADRGVGPAFPFAPDASNAGEAHLVALHAMENKTTCQGLKGIPTY